MGFIHNAEGTTEWLRMLVTSTEGVIFIELTSTGSQLESWLALLCRRQLPALVTKTVGTQNLPVRSSMSRRKASAEWGSTLPPRTITPSISKKSPKSGCKSATSVVAWNKRINTSEEKCKPGNGTVDHYIWQSFLFQRLSLTRNAEQAKLLI